MHVLLYEVKPVTYSLEIRVRFRFWVEVRVKIEVCFRVRVERKALQRESTGILVNSAWYSTTNEQAHAVTSNTKNIPLTHSSSVTRGRKRSLLVCLAFDFKLLGTSYLHDRYVIFQGPP